MRLGRCGYGRRAPTPRIIVADTATTFRGPIAGYCAAGKRQLGRARLPANPDWPSNPSRWCEKRLPFGVVPPPAMIETCWRVKSFRLAGHTLSPPKPLMPHPNPQTFPTPHPQPHPQRPTRPRTQQQQQLSRPVRDCEGWPAVTAVHVARWEVVVSRGLMMQHSGYSAALRVSWRAWKSKCRPG